MTARKKLIIAQLDHLGQNLVFKFKFNFLRIGDKLKN